MELYNSPQYLRYLIHLFCNESLPELTEEKRFALAAALLFRQLAQAYDDAADMLIRRVQRIHHPPIPKA